MRHWHPPAPRVAPIAGAPHPWWLFGSPTRRGGCWPRAAERCFDWRREGFRVVHWKGTVVALRLRALASHGFDHVRVGASVGALAPSWAYGVECATSNTHSFDSPRRRRTGMASVSGKRTRRLGGAPYAGGRDMGILSKTTPTCAVDDSQCRRLAEHLSRPADVVAGNASAELASITVAQHSVLTGAHRKRGRM